MSYKPKFCCQCGEKVERTVWHLWTSRRFCELCATNFGIYDKLQNGLLIALALISIVGVGNMLRRPEKELVISANQLAGSYPNANKQTIQQTNPPANSERNNNQNALPVNAGNYSQQTKQTLLQPAQKQFVKQTEIKPAEPEAVVYFCGAQTKKGTPCTRRVKNGGRCWQHLGQPAMLPQQKLLASQ